MAVGQRGWIVLTKDRHFRSNYLEIAALIRGKVKAFALKAADMSGAGMGKAFAVALPQMRRFIARFAAPFIGHISEGGNVSMAVRGSQLYERFIKGER